MKTIAVAVAALLIGTPLFAQPADTELAKRQETIGIIHDLGTLWFSWLADNVMTEDPAPLDGDPGPIPERATGPDAEGRQPFDLRATGRPLTHEEFLALLRPYVDSLGGDPTEIPTHDAWDRPLEFRFRWNLLAPQVMSIRSPGSDGEYSGMRTRSAPSR
jgi:hypothetical protein